MSDADSRKSGVHTRVEAHKGHDPALRSDPAEVRVQFEKAKSALFALEEFIGPLGSDERRSIYALRVQLGYIGGAILKRKENEAYAERVGKKEDE